MAGSSEKVGNSATQAADMMEAFENAELPVVTSF